MVAVNNAVYISHNTLLIALFHFENWIAFLILQSTRKRFIKFPPHRYAISLLSLRHDEGGYGVKKFKRAKRRKNLFHHWLWIFYIMTTWLRCGERDERAWMMSKINNFQPRKNSNLFSFFRRGNFSNKLPRDAQQPTTLLNIWTFIVGIETSPRETRKCFSFFHGEFYY